MGHAVMTHAPTQPRTIHPHQLSAPTVDQVNDLLDQANEHADRHNLTASALLHAQAIRLIGIQPPACGELARCTCTTCYCDAYFDAAKARSIQDGRFWIVQCETCADEHRLTGE